MAFAGGLATGAVASASEKMTLGSRCQGTRPTAQRTARVDVNRSLEVAAVGIAVGEAAVRVEREDGQSPQRRRRRRVQTSCFARSQSRITDWPLGNRSRTCRREHGGADAQLSRIRGRLSGGRLVRTVKPILLAIVFALLDDLRRVLRPYDPHVSGSSRGFQRSLSMRGRQSQLRRPARLAKGSAAVVTDASDGHRGRVSADGDLDGRRASGVAFEVVAIPYGNVVGSSPCLFLKSKFIRKIAGSRR